MDQWAASQVTETKSILFEAVLEYNILDESEKFRSSANRTHEEASTMYLTGQFSSAKRCPETAKKKKKKKKNIRGKLNLPSFKKLQSYCRATSQD